MNFPRPEYVLNYKNLMTLLENVTPEGDSYGLDNLDPTVRVVDTDQRVVLESGQAGPGYRALLAHFSEVTLLLEITTWDGLNQEPSNSATWWGSRHGVISSTWPQVRPESPEALEQEVITLRTSHRDQLYFDILDSVGLGPRRTDSPMQEIRIGRRTLLDLAPDQNDRLRRRALNRLIKSTASTMPDISAHLEQEQLRYMLVEHRIHDSYGPNKSLMFWIDTPAGILAPTRGYFRPRMSILLPSVAWSTLAALVPNNDDLMLWEEMAEQTKSERVNFDPSI